MTREQTLKFMRFGNYLSFGLGFWVLGFRIRGCGVKLRVCNSHPEIPITQDRCYSWASGPRVGILCKPVGSFRV